MPGRSPRLVCGKLSNVTRELEIFDRDAKLVRTFHVEHQSQTLTVSGGGADFEVQLPWAREVVALEGGERVAAPAGREPGTAGGVVVRATSERMSLTWS